VKMAVTLWAIWSSRRKAIHEGIFQTPAALLAFVNRFIAELQLLQEKKPRVVAAGTTTASSGVARPKAPPLDYAKIHVDAAVAQAGGSASAVCRDHNGNYLGSSSLVIAGVCNLVVLEAMACREALSLAANLHLHNFVIACDSKKVVGDIKQGSHGRIGALISEIKTRATSFNCIFTFEGSSGQC
jgi:hypothetical protein